LTHTRALASFVPDFRHYARNKSEKPHNLNVRDPGIPPRGRRLSPRLDTMEELTKAELSEMISEAIVDAHDEEEQLMGFATVIDNELEVPFQTTVLGVKVTVEHVTQRSHGLVASCVRGQHRQAIHILDLPLPKPPPKGAEWIAAYRHWMRY
jgi:hypothetical protein